MTLDLPLNALEIITSLQNAGFEAYAVGGSIRDLLIGKPTHGWDFTTNATPEEILKVFPDSFYDNQFGTVGIKIYANGHKIGIDEKPLDIYEVTTFRSEKEYTDYRHPDNLAWGTSLTEDLSRRDFTMNAIAYDGKTLTDPYGGQTAIQNKLIQTVGDANKRFLEDALRMMRAVRFAAQLGFTVEESTALAISKNADLLTKISSERVRDEFFKILTSEHAADAILVLKNVGLLRHILPELEVSFATPQKSPKRHHLYDVGTHSIMALKYCPSTDPLVRLATLIHDLGKPKTYKVLDSGIVTFYNHEVVGAHLAKHISKRMRLSKKDEEKLITLVRWHQFSVDERQTDSAIRRFIRRVGKENLADILALRIGDRLGGGALETSWRLELYKKRIEEVQLQPFGVADLKIDGHDVMKIFDITPSRKIGEVLESVFADVEKNILANDRDVLLAHLEKLHTEEK
jgi:putative nucleotidyltransferase with HDIG domain